MFLLIEPLTNHVCWEQYDTLDEESLRSPLVSNSPKRPRRSIDFPEPMSPVTTVRESCLTENVKSFRIGSFCPGTLNETCVTSMACCPDRGLRMESPISESSPGLSERVKVFL